MPQLIQFINATTGEPILVRTTEILHISSFKGGAYVTFTLTNGSEVMTATPYRDILDMLKKTASIGTVLPVQPA